MASGGAGAGAGATAADASVTTAAAKTNPVRVILGTMTFAGQTDKAATIKQLQTFVENHKGETRDRWELDTARMYSMGKTEEFIGEVFDEFPELRKKYIVATKANPFQNPFGETLRPESVKKQVEESLAAMKAASSDILYLHAPDPTTKIEVTLAAVQELYEAGKFRELGLSNYAAWEVVHVWHICDRNGWIKPTLYQGMYNAITRQVEMELFPALRTLGIRFYAYNPLAGGMLTGKHKDMDTMPTDGRFGSWTGPMYRARYWKKTYFDALEIVQKACDAEGISMPDAALRWLMHHSELKGGLNDGVIIGASSQSHLDGNVTSCNNGPLPEGICKAYDEAWVLAKPTCPKYFRP